MKMKAPMYLILRRVGRGPQKRPRLVGRVTKTKPSLKADELAVRIEVSIDDELFERPSLSASLTLDERHVQRSEIEIAPVEGEEAP